MSRHAVRITALAVVLSALLAATVSSAAWAADPVATSLAIAQDPAYVYSGDEVTVHVTVSPNPGAGTVAIGWSIGEGDQTAMVPVDPATGVATHTFTPIPDLNGSVRVRATFLGTAGFAESGAMKLLDVRFLPNVVITAPPTPATSSHAASATFVTSAGVTTSCRIDGGSWDPCASPWSGSGFPEGSHALDIRATNPDGRSGAPASATWIVDTTAPAGGPVSIDDGATETNCWAVQLAYPGTDAGSGIAFVRVSRTGDVDADGHLTIVGGAHPTATDYWTANDGLETNWHIDPGRPSGPQTAWVQWVDAAGNWSTVQSDSIDVRLARLVLAGGDWSTTASSVSLGVAGIAPHEIKSFVWSGQPGTDTQMLADHAPTLQPPTTVTLTDPGRGQTSAEGLKRVFAYWKDARGRWSQLTEGAIGYSSSDLPDVVLDGGVSPSADETLIADVSVPIGADGFSTILEYSCDGVSWAGFPLVGDFPVHVGSGDAGCPAGDGPRSMKFRWALLDTLFTDQAWSDVRTVEVTVDHAAISDGSAPDGSVTVAGGASFTISSHVAVAAPATDAETLVARMRLSNDGSTWTSLPFAPTIDWTLAPGSGTRTVSVQWRDAVGNWSASKTASIAVDAAKPTTTVPTTTISKSQLGSGTVPVRVGWSGADVGLGVRRYEVARSRDGGAWTTVASNLTSPVYTAALATGHTYRFRVRAIDKAGNVGAWTDGAASRLTAHQESSAAVRCSSAWGTARSSVYWGGRARFATATGARCSFGTKARSVALVSRPGPNRGVARVYVDGKLVATVNLHATTYRARRVVWSGHWSTAASRSIVIKVSGTPGHRRRRSRWVRDRLLSPAGPRMMGPTHRPTIQRSLDDRRHQDRAPDQGVRRAPRHHRPRPGGRRGRDLRVPRAERRRQDDDHARPARPHPADVRAGRGVRHRDDGGSGGDPPAGRLPAGRIRPVRPIDGRPDHRLLRQPARRGRQGVRRPSWSSASTSTRAGGSRSTRRATSRRSGWSSRSSTGRTC